MSKFTLIVLLLVLSGCDQITGPADYDDCILKSMKGVTSDMAARAIIASCQEKFPPHNPENDPQLAIELLRQLTGHAGMTSYGYFGGNIHNGTKEWTVTQVTIELTPEGKEKNDPGEVKKYNANVSVSPLTSASFSFQVDGPQQEYSWNIVAARGHKK